MNCAHCTLSVCLDTPASAAGLVPRTPKGVFIGAMTETSHFPSLPQVLPMGQVLFLPQPLPRMLQESSNTLGVSSIPGLKGPPTLPWFLWPSAQWWHRWPDCMYRVWLLWSTCTPWQPTQPLPHLMAQTTSVTTAFQG